MAKQRKPTEEKHGAQATAPENSQVAPGCEGCHGEVPAGERCGDCGLEGPAPVAEPPELWGFGVEPGAGGWLAFRVSSHGKVEILNPRRNGEIAGERRHSALARMQTAIKHAYLGPQKRGG